MDSINANFHQICISNDVKSIFVLKQIFNIINKSRIYNIIKYNMNLQKKLKSLLQIEIEIIPKKYDYGKFINDSFDINKLKIYFNDNKEEIKRVKFNEDDKINKIKILIDNNVKSLKDLFRLCFSIKKINCIA